MQELAHPAMLIRQFLHFMAVGAGGTAVQYAVLWAGVSCDLAPAAVSSAVGYLLGSILSYLLNYFFTFASDKTHREAAAKFFTLVGVGWGINTTLMGFLVHGYGWNVWPAQIITTSICLVWNFAGSKWWAFRQRTSAS
jgi:putative flippase GtrA